jgi:hypothetical protein
VWAETFGATWRDLGTQAHEVIFYEVGPNYPAQLPNVSFYMEY